MKKTNKKLKLNRESLKLLSEKALDDVAGGGSNVFNSGMSGAFASTRMGC